MSDNVHDHDGIQERQDTKVPAYFNLLFYGLIVWGVIFSAYFIFSGWSSTEEYAEKQAAHDKLTAGQ